MSDQPSAPISIVRYSRDGFVAKRQSKHMYGVWHELFKFNSHESPVHLRSFSVERHLQIVPFYREHLADFNWGVWVFIDGHDNMMSLNHIRGRDRVGLKRWTAVIPEDTEVYGVGWDVIVPINSFIPQMFGCFIPKRHLPLITDIKCDDDCDVELSLEQYDWEREEETRMLRRGY
jgi:hypothetical protein